MENVLTPQNVLLLTSLLFCIGVYGVLARKNLLIVLMSLELMLVAVNIALVLFSRMQAGALVDGSSLEAFQLAHAGQFFTLMVMAVAAGEVGVGLAIVVRLYQVKKKIELDAASELKL